MTMKEGRLVLGAFRSERMRVLFQSRQDDRLRVMLVLVHIDIIPPHTSLPMFRRIGERTIPYSWRAYDATTAARKSAVQITSGSPMNEGRFVLGTFRSEGMQVLYRSRQDDHLRVMLVLVHVDITPPQLLVM
ncbi:uncharacterized protein TNCV_3779281 [Trichonephila clavipes]|nr:uncharacterized protein TNCV_3779281 [Trichonephila clavipes]